MKKNLHTLSVCLCLLWVFIILPGCDHPLDKEIYGNCSDNIKNQGESETDCGGPCMACASCDDGIKNITETGIDCGGNCQSCSPACTITPETISYTLFPASFTTSYTTTQQLYGTGKFSGSSISIDFSGGGSTGLTRMEITFQANFNPLTYIPLNETMVLKTIDPSYQSLDNKSKVQIRYYGNFGFSYMSGTFSALQPIYITRVSNSTVLLKFCNAKAGKESFSMTATVD